MSKKKSLTRVSGVSTVIRLVVAVMAIVAFAAMFLPQLKNPLANRTEEYYYLGVLFGMTDNQGGGQVVSYVGNYWGVIAYVLILAGGLVGAVAGLKKAEGAAKVTACIVGAVLILTGGILAFCSANIFDYMNDAGFVLAAGPIVAGTIAMVATVVELVAAFFR